MIVQLIAATTTKAGLTVRCELDSTIYSAGVKVSDEAINAIELRRHQFHGEWNYKIRPHSSP